MIYLDTEVSVLRAHIAGAPATTNPTYNVFFHEVRSQAKPTFEEYKGGRSSGLLSGATPVNICAAPAKGITRDIEHISIYNADTASVVATVGIYDGTSWLLIVHTLTTLQTLCYEHGSGWSVL